MRLSAGLQERIEASAPGRVAISLVIVATLACVAASNLPQSHVRRTLLEGAGPYLNATGLDQDWNLFAPDPRRVSLGLEARVTYADGSVERWRAPQRGALLGAYSGYRWRRLAESTILHGGDEALARRIATWIARERQGGRQRPLYVQLVMRYARLPPPGPQAGRPQRYLERALLELPLGRRGG